MSAYSGQRSKPNSRLAAREAMQRVGYDPIDELVKIAQSDGLSLTGKKEVAEILLPYMYPKLSAVVMDADVTINDDREMQEAMMMKMLSDPTLADAAAKLSLAAADCAIEESIAKSGRQQGGYGDGAGMGSTGRLQ